MEHPGQRGLAEQHALDSSHLGEPRYAIIALPIGGSGLSPAAHKHAHMQVERRLADDPLRLDE